MGRRRRRRAAFVGTLGGAEKILRRSFSRGSLVGRPVVGTASRRETSRTQTAYLEDCFHRDAPRARPAFSGAAARPRTFERSRRRKYEKNESRELRTHGFFGCPPRHRKRRARLFLDPRHFAALPAASTRRRDAGASRRKLRHERRAVLRVHGGRLLRHKRAAAGARSGGTRVDESRRVANTNSR